MSPVSNHVGTLSIIFMCLTVLICFGGPVFLAIWFRRKYKKAFSLIPLLAGVLGFLISQVVFRQPVLQYSLPHLEWYRQLTHMPWLYVLFLSFTAGLVEEPARFIAFMLMKKRRGFADGLSYGIGHGGLEAVLVVGFAYVGNIVLSIMINSGIRDLPGSLAPATVISTLAGMPSYLFLIAGIERIFAASLHIALTLVVLKGFQVGKRALYLLLSIILHGAANFLAMAAVTLGMQAVPKSPQLGGILFSESFLLIVMVVSVLYIVKRAKQLGFGRSSLRLDDQPDR